MTRTDESLSVPVDVSPGTFDGLWGRLDIDPHTRGRQFERICSWFLGADPAYRHDLRRVWLWDEWPGRWGQDAGIDLVAEDRQGRLWAIQAKAYAELGTVTKADVDSFLSESNRPEFSFRLLIATTNRLGSNARKVIDGQEKPVGVVLRGDLERAEVAWPSSPDDLRAPVLECKQPRPHQVAAVDAVVAGFERSDRGQLVMACGTGKTLASLFIAERLEATRTLVLLPSLSLLAQTLREWTANASRDFEFLPVCSDETVADRDAMVASTAELGLPVTTNADEVARFLRGRGPRVIFATYQSSPRIADAYLQGRVPRIDLVIADEAHRCAGRAAGDFATVLNPDAIRARRRLFMTATPRYFTGRVIREAKEADLEVASMDDEATFGPVFHRLTFGEAIDRDLLSDYQVAIIGVDDATYRQWAEHGRLVTIDGDQVTDSRTLAGQIGVAKAVARYDLHRVISFHSRVAAARRFANTLPEVIEWMPPDQRPDGDLWADHVSGQMPTGDRDTRLGHLRRLEPGQRGLLANARCLAEGVDVPTLDGVAFIDPRRSEVDIVQAVGRAIRKAPDKSLGTIVLPVFIGDTDDPEAALDDSAFKPVWEVLKALRAHDEDLAEQLDDLRRQLGRGGGITLPDKIHIDLPEAVTPDFALAFAVQLVEQTTASWEAWYALLVHHVAQRGDARVPLEFVTDNGYRLGHWVNNQRASRRKGELSAARTERLASINGWSWDPHTEAWEEGFAHLRDFVDDHGHARVPQLHLTVDNYSLGAWVASQRTAHRHGKLPVERVERLDSINGWSWDPHTEAWEEGFAHLRDFVDDHGHAGVPKSLVTADGYSLGAWVDRQRTAHRRAMLPAGRVDRLDAIQGWTWDPLQAAWEEGFTRLQSYAAQHGHASFRRGFVTPDGYKLGHWVNTQRAARRKRRLSRERTQRLEGLDGWHWDPMAGAWEEGFAHLRDYIGDHGNARVAQSHVAADGYRLGSWVNRQRQLHSRGALAPDRKVRLENLPQWMWDPLAIRWEDGFAQLQAYVAEHGHAGVPAKHSTTDGYPLGQWTRGQRTRRNEMPADRKTRLEALPGWTWDALAARWETAFAALEAYVAREGHARVPHKHVEQGVRLGEWVNTQRTVHTTGNMPRDRLTRLESLPGWLWRVHDSRQQSRRT